jgi:hypothetical protein
MTKSFALAFVALALSAGAALASPAAAPVAGDPPTASFTVVAHDPASTSWLDYQNGVFVRPSVGLNQNPNIHPQDSSAALLNETGGDGS